MKKHSGLGSIAAVGFVLALSTNAAALTTDSADDVCAANANPCQITERVDVAANATLDFGTRTLELSGDGQLSFEAGPAKIISGPFTANTDGPAIFADLSLSPIRNIEIEARRACSAGPSPHTCIDSSDCQLGACGTRRCSTRPARLCSADANCQIGPCSLSRCQGSPTFLRCSTNADCDFGTCPSQPTCANLADGAVDCSTNSDCNFGGCSVGSASMLVGGAISARSRNPPHIFLRAADSLTVSGRVNLRSRSTESGGGQLTLLAAAGDAVLGGKMSARGGSLAEGGLLDMRAGRDVTVGADVDVNGGDSDGGSVVTDSGRDTHINARIGASSISGGGFGGQIVANADGDLTIGGPSVARTVLLSLNGHTVEDLAGDGGTLELATGGNVTIGANVKISAMGSKPDGTGGEISIESGGDLFFDADINARARGFDGIGGILALDVIGKGAIGSNAALSFKGGAGGGALVASTQDDFAFGGSVDVSSTGGGGGVEIDSFGRVSITGSMNVGGGGGGEITVDACRISVAGTGGLVNKTAGGKNHLTAHESMSLLAGSSMLAPSGSNVLTYRDPAKPPVISGVVNPAPVLELDEFLEGCPVCGNLEIDEDETCDDGNTVEGDGCDSDCLTE